MSGHNQHSRVSQPVNSSSWNPLQVPSYIPRQPQLAHMSSERPIHSTSMIWPNATPNPADFYNYMALTAAAAANSNHKNVFIYFDLFIYLCFFVFNHFFVLFNFYSVLKKILIS